MIYYELLEDNTIGRSTTSKKVADKLGLQLETDKEIVYAWNGKRYFRGNEPTPPELSYTQKRLAEYPEIGEQLDMIYWDKVKGTNNWQEKIAEIKAKYPKK